MPRSYEKEAAWEKQRYHRLHIKLTPDVHAGLQAILQRTGKTLSAWVREKIAEDERNLENPKSLQ